MGAKAKIRARGATRANLLAAARRALQSGDVGDLTTSGLARSAGVSQPAFYAHFRDMDELVAEVVELVGQDLYDFVETAQASLRAAGPLDYAANVTHFRAILERAERERGVLQLFARHRGSQSPLGRRFRLVEADFVHMIADHVRSNLTAFELYRPDCEPDITALAWAIHHIVLGGYEMLFARRLDRGRLAELMAAEILAASGTIFPSAEVSR